jgi:septal ring factor EnvC (AmiA/AmiB activator)
MSEVTIRNRIDGLPEVWTAELTNLTRVDSGAHDRPRLVPILKEIQQAVDTTTQVLNPLCSALTTAINKQVGKPIEICMSPDCVKALTHAACEAVLVGNKGIDEISAKLDGLCKFREETESKAKSFQTSLSILGESQSSIQMQTSETQVKLANMERRWFDTDTHLLQCREKISRCEEQLAAVPGWAAERFAEYRAELANEFDARFSELSARVSGAIDDIAAVQSNIADLSNNQRELRDQVDRCCKEAKEEIRGCAELLSLSKTSSSEDKAEIFKTISHLAEQIAEVALRLDDLDRQKGAAKPQRGANP